MKHRNVLTRNLEASDSDSYSEDDDCGENLCEEEADIFTEKKKKKKIGEKKLSES